MKRPVKIILIILTAISTIAFLIMIAIFITMQAEYWGMRMGNEASGFFSAALMLTLIVGIPTAILWTILLKQRKRKTSVM